MNTLKNLLIFFLVSTLFLCTGCKDSISNDTFMPVETPAVFIVNEGGWGQNNSTLSLYNPISGQVTENAYEAANPGVKLGDTGNDFATFGLYGAVVVSTSNKVEIFSYKTLKKVRSIDFGANSNPRNIVIANETTAFVSTFNGEVVKFNPTTGIIEKKIAVGSYPEGMALVNSKLYVANTGLGGGNTISIIDTALNTEIAKVNVGINPRFVLKGLDGLLYIICTGTYDVTGRGAIYRIYPNNNTIKDSLIVLQNPGRSCIIGSTKLLTVTNDGVASINIGTGAFTQDTAMFVSSKSINSISSFISSLCYDYLRDVVYCGNPKDFIQKGEIVVLSTSGIEKKRFSTGLNPGSIFILY